MDTTTATPAGSLRIAALPRWVDRLFFGLVIYAIAASASLLTDLAGPVFTNNVAMLSVIPSTLIGLIISAATARRAAPGAGRNAWISLSIALALYVIGLGIAFGSRLAHRDPFPGPADIFFYAFYPAIAAASLYLMRAATLRVSRIQLLLDAMIFVAGFGAFFWCLVIHPAVLHAQVNLLKEGLSQAYVALDCMVLLLLGVLLLTGAEEARRPRIHALLLSGFAIMFLGDITWSLAKMSGHYLPGGIHDVLYLWCFVPVAAAARQQLADFAAPPARARPKGPGALARVLPSAALLAAFVVMVYVNFGDSGRPASSASTMVFALMLLFMARQGVVLRLAENRYASLIANASDLIMIVGPEGILRFASPACERMLGTKPDEIIGRDLTEFWTGEDCERLEAFLTEVAASHSGTIGPVELGIGRGAQHRFTECVGTNLTRDSAVQGLALNFRDISERKALEAQLRQLALQDPLTQLANRSLFRDRVHHALTLAQRNKSGVAVMFLDLDNFKNINDSLGHDAGDRLLRNVAQRIVAACRSSDTVARLGGDEFAVLLEGIAAVAEVEGSAAALLEKLQAPLVLDGKELRVTASIGIACSAGETAPEALLSNADIAMYHAKAAGKSRYITFRPQMQDLLQERLRLEADIGRALAQQELFLEYQPIVDLGSRSILGVEALVRWRHPEAGVLMPARFIQVMEECGHVAELGRWVLRQACRDMCAWRESIAGGSALRLAVNISARHLEQGDLVHDVTQALRESGLEADNLVIELTESTIMASSGANLERFRRLKALGVRLAIDDFGTGYSSLSYLHRFPIDILKIDRSFVSRLTNSDSGPELVRMVVTIGETLGLDTVAEGIELEEQAAALLALGCVAGQGFLFARAGSLDELLHGPFVARRNALWTAHAAREALSATGRFKALRALDRSA